LIAILVWTAPAPVRGTRLVEKLNGRSREHAQALAASYYSYCSGVLLGLGSGSSGLDPPQYRAMIWVVKASPTTQQSTGLLQQLYSADRSAPPPHPPPLVGETNSEIVLQALDDPQAQNSADKRSDAAVTIVLVALKLLSSPA